MKKRNMKMTSAVLAAALAAVSLAGCGGSGKTETTAAAGSTDTTAAETGSEAESSEAAGGETKEGGYKVAMTSATCFTASVYWLPGAKIRSYPSSA